MLTIQETKDSLFAAKSHFGSSVLSEPESGLYHYKIRLENGDVIHSPREPRGVNRANRVRGIILRAADMAGGMAMLNPAGMSEPARGYHRALLTRFEGQPRRTGWKWSDESRQRASLARRSRIAEAKRNAARVHDPAILAARQTMARATASALVIVESRYPSLSPRQSAAMATWIASGL